ncbi:TadE/TadG family type IV pilus assembly protein [Pseudonocardia hydrocarbonoxydans]|uniref:TadE/TadG family type IV pilus assembly protein n=1 Tax=Pseudonocardia hydrocarbonoxydans TaxID=76726 RepID=UPI0031D1D2BB
MHPCTAESADRERGGATSVELALLWSALLLLILGVVQVAMVSFAGQLALTAAQDGLRSGRTFRADTMEQALAESARRDAEGFLARTSGTVLTDVVVATELDGGAGLLRVRVTGTALSLIPGVPLSVEREAVGPIEQVAP